MSGGHVPGRSARGSQPAHVNALRPSWSAEREQFGLAHRAESDVSGVVIATRVSSAQSLILSRRRALLSTRGQTSDCGSMKTK